MQQISAQLRTAALRNHYQRLEEIRVAGHLTPDEREAQRDASEQRLERDITAAHARGICESIEMPAELSLIETELQIEHCMNLTEGHAERVWRGAR